MHLNLRLRFRVRPPRSQTGLHPFRAAPAAGPFSSVAPRQTKLPIWPVDHGYPDAVCQYLPQWYAAHKPQGWFWQITGAMYLTFVRPTTAAKSANKQQTMFYHELTSPLAPELRGWLPS